MLDRCLFLESCRQCRKYIIGPRSSPARTVCHLCWQEVESYKPNLEYCRIDAEAQIPVISAAPYEGLIKTLVHRLKYQDDRLIAFDLALLLDHTLELLENERSLKEALLIPIPLSFWREFKRGFNQAEILASKLSKSRRLSMDKKALRRHCHTKAQHALNKAQRIQNLSGAFSADKNKVRNKYIILVDDIYTSGATLSEAAKILLSGGASGVAAITAARALLKND